METTSLVLDRKYDFWRIKAYDASLEKEVSKLPYAKLNSDAVTWEVDVTLESYALLLYLHRKGSITTDPFTLLREGEVLKEATKGRLEKGARSSRPFVVTLARQDDSFFMKLRKIKGGMWSKKDKKMYFGSGARAALADLVEEGILDDPESLLKIAELTVIFDNRYGNFKVLGDPRAEKALHRKFPREDVVSNWKSKGFGVAFADEVSEEVYQSELIKAGHVELQQPEGLLLPLFDHQIENVALATVRTGFSVFDEPGVGKTPVGVAAGHNLLKNKKEVSRVIVVCPSGLRTNWDAEIRRFTGNSSIVLIEGTAEQRIKAYEEAKTADWLIVHYDVLYKDEEYLVPLAADAFVIADEVHRCKSWSAKRTKALSHIGRVAKKRLGLSGTPLENSPSEWYEVLSFASPGCLGERFSFLNTYMWKNRWGAYERPKKNAQEEMRVRSMPHYVRHSMEDVAEHLPPLTVQHLPLNIEDKKLAAVIKKLHQQAKEELKKEAVNKAEKKHKQSLSEAQKEKAETSAELTAVGMLRMLCSSPRLLHMSNSEAAQALVKTGLVPDEDGPKMDELREIVRELKQNNERVVIFSSSKQMIKLIGERFKKDKVEYVTFTGDDDKATRDESVRRFTSPKEPVTAFLATDAAAEGLNLGKTCNLLINVDLAYTATRMIQRACRIRRIDGTHKNYRVINFTIEGTMEEKLLKIVEAKADLMDAMFGEEKARAASTGTTYKGVALDNLAKAILSWEE